MVGYTHGDIYEKSKKNLSRPSETMLTAPFMTSTPNRAPDTGWGFAAALRSFKECDE